MGRIQVRMPDVDVDRWQAAAKVEGVPVSLFVKRAVEERIASRTTRALANAVALAVLPEMERMHGEVMAAFSASPGFTVTSAFPPVVRPFERGCLDSEFHTPQTVCSSCGGSYNA